MLLARVKTSACSRLSVVTLAFAALGILLGPGRAWGALQVSGANASAAPGRTCRFRVSLTGATNVSVGRVGLRITGPSGAPVPTVEDAVPVTTASGGLLPSGTGSGDDLSTGVFEKILTGLPSNIQAIAAFMIINGINGSGPIIDFVVRIPSTATVGTTYNVTLTEIDFSDTSANQIDVTATYGTLSVVQAELKPGQITTVPAVPAGVNGVVLPPSGAPTSNPESFSGYAIIPYALKGVEGGVTWTIERLAGQESWPAADLGTIQDISDASGTRAKYTAPAVTHDRLKAQTVRLRCRSNVDPNLTFTVDVKVLPYGDANLSGLTALDGVNAVTVSDAVAVFRWSLGLLGARRRFDAPSDLQLILCDIAGGTKIPVVDDAGRTITDTYLAQRNFGNGQITSSDAVKVFRVQLGLTQVP
ncbi:MAG: hypothetical protein ACUVRO_10445 [Armatimonadota bacterium]